MKVLGVGTGNVDVQPSGLKLERLGMMPTRCSSRGRFNRNGAFSVPTVQGTENMYCTLL